MLCAPTHPSKPVRKPLTTLTLALLIAAGAAFPVGAQGPYPPMMTALGDFEASTLFTIGETVAGFTPTGVPDGIGAFEVDSDTVRIYLNHEHRDDRAYSYDLANGTTLVGARISFYDIDRETREVVDAGIAYDTVYDRAGALVVDALQINEADTGTDNGFDRLCSGQGYEAGDYGFVDDIYFAGEESSVTSGHPHGGTVWALDVEENEIWAAPALGRGAWENVTAIDSDSDDHIALLLGDDTDASPLYLYLGEKDAIGDGSFLDRNGLASGILMFWESTDGDLTPEDFNGTGAESNGVFTAIEAIDPAMANEPGYDEQGYLDDTTLRAAAAAAGAFLFSRPEDLHTNPDDDNEVAFASTGAANVFPSDTWGTIYVIGMDLHVDLDDGKYEIEIEAEIEIVHDGDDFGDFGIRSPDNLTWADDKIYVQEDPTVGVRGLFGVSSGFEASIWALDDDGAFERIAEMDRSAVAPTGSTDNRPNDIGSWESSGILDVTELFDADELLLIGTVQAQTVRNGDIATLNLERGGQVIFLEEIHD